MKLDPGCCRCCATSLEIAARHAALERQGKPGGARRPIHGCYCRGRLAHERCACPWCRACVAWWPRCARATCDEPTLWGDLCRLHQDQRRESDRRRAERSRDVRQPPRPPHERTEGACSMCGLTPLPGRRRSWCSDECVNLWYIATSGQVALKHLTDLHGWSCWSCGAAERPAPVFEWARWSDVPAGLYPLAPVPVRLEVEHVRPLWSLTAAERSELRWWLPFNLQLLCSTCHKAKSAEETRERARLRRLARQT